MKNLTVGIFHDEQIGRELGKKGTESDIAMFNRKTDDQTITFMQPVGDKLSAKAQIMSSIDAAVISFARMGPEVGESILMLDSLKVLHGVCIVPKNTEMHTIVAITKGTSLESFVIKDADPHEILRVLECIEPKRDNKSPVVVIVDHSFHVNGVGEVILGFVRSGVVHKHDKLQLLPANKEVVVRSIQMHDKDFDEADAGSRVGLALKGAVVDELKRGSVLCAPGSMRSDKKLKLSFHPNKFYQEGVREGVFHVSVGMQTLPVKVSEVSKHSITIESETPVVYSGHDIFLLLDLNAKNVHIAGKGQVKA
jgi:selenocysteine-specific translation elongation factor